MDNFVGCKIVIEKHGETERLCEVPSETSVSFMNSAGPVTIPVCPAHDEQLSNGRIMVGVGSDRGRWLIQLNPDSRSQDNGDANDAVPERTSAESSQPNEAGGAAESGGSKDPVGFDAQADQKSGNGERVGLE